jgi:hypothetical protein
MIRPGTALLLILLAPWPAMAAEVLLQPGRVGSIHISGEHDITYRCASPGQCIMRGGASINNSSNIVFDGFRVEGAAQGLRITNSDNVTVQNSTFVEQTSAGVSVQPGPGSRNVVIRNNEFQNSKTGCSFIDPGNCSGHLSDGSPVSLMDYGVRIYGDGTTAEISGNHFSSLFNHAISLKSGASAVNITSNTFDSCGRNCIELGQESEVGEVYIARNNLQGRALKGILIKDVRKVSIVDNNISITGIPIYMQPGNYGSRVVDQKGGTAVIIEGPPDEPPYVYVPPVIEDGGHRRDRVQREGSPEADKRRLRVVEEGPPEHNCCDDPNNPIDPSVMQRLKKIQGAPGVNWMR